MIEANGSNGLHVKELLGKKGFYLLGGLLFKLHLLTRRFLEIKIDEDTIWAIGSRHGAFEWLHYFEINFFFLANNKSITIIPVDVYIQQ